MIMCKVLFEKNFHLILFYNLHLNYKFCQDAGFVVAISSDVASEEKYSQKISGGFDQTWGSN